MEVYSWENPPFSSPREHFPSQLLRPALRRSAPQQLQRVAPRRRRHQGTQRLQQRPLEQFKTAWRQKNGTKRVPNIQHLRLVPSKFWFGSELHCSGLWFQQPKRNWEADLGEMWLFRKGNLEARIGQKMEILPLAVSPRKLRKCWRLCPKI